MIGSWLLVAALAAAGADARPRVGLALEGGGAKGLAHVGVLAWLEEHRIPVDLVGGTSMGGLVGGAYATGLSATEVKDLLAGVDWDLMFLADVPYRDKTLRRKEDRRSFPTRVEMGLKGGLKLASGLETGHQVGLLLSDIAWAHSAVADFGDLPIPFRCVAVDIEKGEPVVLSGGVLGEALRATMAIPGVFSPVRVNGRLLVDGGVLDNLPVDVVRDMGADVVVGVNLVGDMPTTTPESLLALAGRSISVMSEHLTRPRVVDVDVLVEPDVEGLGTTDWRRLDALVERGYRAAEAASARLLPLALSEEAWREHLAARQARRHARLEVPAFVAAEGAPLEATAPAWRDLLATVGQPLDRTILDRQLTRLVGTGRYESASYREGEQDSRRGLVVHLREKSYAPPYVNAALEISNVNDNLDFNLGTRATFFDVAGAGGEWRIDAVAGSRLGLATELYRPLGGPLFAAPRASVGREQQTLYEDGQSVARYEHRRRALGMDLGLANRHAAEVRVGVTLADLETRLDIGSPVLEESEGREVVLESSVLYDGWDTPIIPSRGVRASASARYYTDNPVEEESFATVEGALGVAAAVARRDHVHLEVSGGATVSGAVPQPYRFRLGGPFRLGAFDPGEFTGENFAYTSLGYLKGIGRLPDIVGGPLFLTGTVELGSAWDVLDEARLRSSFTGGLLADTAVGPIFLGLSLGTDGRTNFHVSVGRLDP